MGLYDNDPLGDLGRLQAEMFRAVRLVVDTGMHAKRWSREQAIEYMITKTGMTTEEVTREIERYMVWPGQATAYKTGQLALLAMREEAELKLGERFDLREFHEAVLMNGAMPLDILKDNLSNLAVAYARRGLAWRRAGTHEALCSLPFMHVNNHWAFFHSSPSSSVSWWVIRPILKKCRCLSDCAARRGNPCLIFTQGLNGFEQHFGIPEASRYSIEIVCDCPKSHRGPAPL